MRKALLTLFCGVLLLLVSCSSPERDAKKVFKLSSQMMELYAQCNKTDDENEEKALRAKIDKLEEEANELTEKLDKKHAGDEDYEEAFQAELSRLLEEALRSDKE